MEVVEMLIPMESFDRLLRQLDRALEVVDDFGGQFLDQYAFDAQDDIVKELKGFRSFITELHKARSEYDNE